MPDYRPGQIWRYRARPGEEDSRVTVLKVEPFGEQGTVVHVRVDGLSIQGPGGAEDVITAIAHMPLMSGALDRSVLELEREGAMLPDFERGYQLWKRGVVEGGQGVFDVTVAEGVEYVVRTVHGKREP